LSCAIPELANAIKAAAAKSCFFMLLTPCKWTMGNDSISNYATLQEQIS
jgi:hypothetical protein